MKNFACDVTIPKMAAGLNRIYQNISVSGLNEEALDLLQADLRMVSEGFGLSDKAVVLLAHIMEHQIQNGSDEDDLASYIGCTNIEFIGLHPYLQELEKRGVVGCAKRMNNRNFYYVTREALKSIERDCPFVPKKATGLTTDEVFTRFRMVFSDYQGHNIDTELMLDQLLKVVRDNTHLVFCRKVLDSPLMTECDEDEQRMFFYLCHRMVSFGDPEVTVERLTYLLDYDTDCQYVRRVIAHGNSGLQRAGLVTFGGENFMDTESLALTEEVKRTFFCEATLEVAESHRDLVSAASITPKELFYNAREDEQLGRLASLLSRENFPEVQKRLKEEGMRTGFAVLFSGGPGTGKTASAYELARQTGRDVFAVDMSELKSKWVGDSEKIVKGVFDTYKRMCRSREVAPILLFNEADAIFSQRFEDPQGSADQTLNAVQNICLEAMETLEGIMIATTNLAANFCDEAFARRFIFKVEFSTPEAETRAKIWRSMIDGLTEEDASVLGKEYTFSGGNIENIARKAAVGYVLSGSRADLAELRKYCDEETLAGTNKHNRIGY